MPRAVLRAHRIALKPSRRATVCPTVGHHLRRVRRRQDRDRQDPPAVSGRGQRGRLRPAHARAADQPDHGELWLRQDRLVCTPHRTLAAAVRRAAAGVTAPCPRDRTASASGVWRECQSVRGATGGRADRNSGGQQREATFLDVHWCTRAGTTTLRVSESS